MLLNKTVIIYYLLYLDINYYVLIHFIFYYYYIYNITFMENNDTNLIVLRAK